MATVIQFDIFILFCREVYENTVSLLNALIIFALLSGTHLTAPCAHTHTAPSAAAHRRVLDHDLRLRAAKRRLERARAL